MYSISLYDHDPDDGGEYPNGKFCPRLAAEHLEGPATGLALWQLRPALRKLRDNGWDDVSILVEREMESNP